MKKILLFLIAWVFLVSCTSTPSNQTTDIINPEADYLYFYGATCPHCQELNKQLEDWDYLSKISVEKREVYFNTVNQESFADIGDKLGLTDRERSVPFVLEKSTGTYVTGVTDAFNLLTSKVDSKEAETEVPSN